MPMVLPPWKKAKITELEENGDSSGGDEEPLRQPLQCISNLNASFKSKASLSKPFKVPTFKPGFDRGVSSLSRPLKLGSRRQNMTYRALHSPEDEAALVLFEPPLLTESEKLAASKIALKGGVKPVPMVHVVVDPKLCKVLRPHQREGVKFLYDCVTGRTVENAYGCIMADEMGLGKTLQCIALLWTLIRQSPDPRKPEIDKAIIVCPSTLVKNWANELKKWLGSFALNPLAVDNRGTKDSLLMDLKQFATSRRPHIVQPVLIISYETLRQHAEMLKSCEIGLLLCDEGHRLKNQQNQTFQALNSLNVKRRVIMSGTPVQNDLTEYFSLFNFANPGLLGSPAEFRKNFELPILRGRDSMAAPEEKRVSEAKLSDLYTIANKFIIRRTNELLTKYLPVKYDHVVFCNLTPFQRDVYLQFVKSKLVKNILQGGNSCQPLKAITSLKKLCNHPSLVELKETLGPNFAQLISVPPKYNPKACQPEYSGKMLLLSRMLKQIRKETSDKIVLISNYTQTLDLFEQLCEKSHFGCLRLDGSMNISKRQKLVDQFNDPKSPEFVFLLSSKAGGCGINLIGANRLILFDPDWNPANDGQALARVWRDGQKKDCFIYRFIATGSIEEKIFQRQCHKQSLSSCVVDEEENVACHFSFEKLKELFQLNQVSPCDTHDTYQCKRCFKGRQVIAPPVKKLLLDAIMPPTENPFASMNDDEASEDEDATTVAAVDAPSHKLDVNDMANWNHWSHVDFPKCSDTVLRDCAGDLVSFIFQTKSHEKN